MTSLIICYLLYCLLYITFYHIHSFYISCRYLTCAHHSKEDTLTFAKFSRWSHFYNVFSPCNIIARATKNVQQRLIGLSEFAFFFFFHFGCICWKKRADHASLRSSLCMRASLVLIQRLERRDAPGSNGNRALTIKWTELVPETWKVCGVWTHGWRARER